jgi:histone chaperone ASF1
MEEMKDFGNFWFFCQIYVGPIPEGRHIFVFQADPPDTSRIPEQDALGVTIVLLTCSYRGQEFVRVGYFINNDYNDQELRENPPAKPMFDKMTRNILASKPRVTRFKINWDDMNGNAEQVEGEAGTSENNQEVNGMMEFDDMAMEEPQDENSLVMPPNENSNSLAMEC